MRTNDSIFVIKLGTDKSTCYSRSGGLELDAFNISERFKPFCHIKDVLHRVGKIFNTMWCSQ